ncbi:MAG: hypothetical protein P1R58_05990 [bacterium]|nr:hypothetical protein [bacterium]
MLKSKLALLIIVFILCAPLTGFSQPDSTRDILGEILGEVGFDRSDLGYQPKGYWNRFPLDIPYKLTSFKDLFAEPLKLYDYARVMSNTVELYMDPSYADTNHTGLYKLVYNLGVDKKQGGFRSYSANLKPAPSGSNPLAAAIEKLYAMSDRQTSYGTFGSVASYPNSLAEIDSLSQQLPDTVETILARLILNLADAIYWRNMAFRNCDMEEMQAIFEIRDLAMTQTDGTVYYHQFDDIETTIDRQSLHYAALKVAAIAEETEAALFNLYCPIMADLYFDLKTPFGRIILLGPNAEFSKEPPPKALALAKNGLDVTNSLLVIDFGQSMTYYGTMGATASLYNPVSLLIDLGGDDTYKGRELTDLPSAGVGICGVGLLLDSKGNDNYVGSIYAQGAGLFGVGVLFDREGNDSYKAEQSAQGCGYFGIGLCLDVLGDDDFYLFTDGQGMGGIGGGIGVLASLEGKDKYTAEPYPDKFNMADYHSQGKINGNNAQGSGFGRRGDGSDGHAWAGGLGAIIDINGDDHYYSGNWSLGVGYWFGTGIAVDRNGNDIYESCYFTQGSGAHFCNGILLDEGGDDKHELYETAGAGLGFGWDYTNAFLINKGGNDSYSAKMISMGLAQIRSCAFLIDIGGDDKYTLGENTPGLGEATYRKDYDVPSKLTPYYSYAKSFGGFIDIGGTDRYSRFDKEGNELPETVFKNNALWLQPSRSDSTFGANNFGVGIDIESGTIPEFFKWGE